MAASIRVSRDSVMVCGSFRAAAADRRDAAAALPGGERSRGLSGLPVLVGAILAAERLADERQVWRLAEELEHGVRDRHPVSYTHLTLPTNREV